MVPVLPPEICTCCLGRGTPSPHTTGFHLGGGREGTPPWKSHPAEEQGCLLTGSHRRAGKAGERLGKASSAESALQAKPAAAQLGRSGESSSLGPPSPTCPHGEEKPEPHPLCTPKRQRGAHHPAAGPPVPCPASPWFAAAVAIRDGANAPPTSPLPSVPWNCRAKCPKSFIPRPGGRS